MALDTKEMRDILLGALNKRDDQTATEQEARKAYAMAKVYDVYDYPRPYTTTVSTELPAPAPVEKSPEEQMEDALDAAVRAARKAV